MKRIAVALPIAIALATLAAPVSAAAQVSPSALVAAQPDPPGKAKGHDKEKNEPSKGTSGDAGSSKGGNPPAHSNGNGRDDAPGQVKKAPPVPAAPVDGGDSNANPRSENENEKITYCHVPPGNPANGHPITTSVNAIDPGHLNHPDDVIPPFEYVKQGETVTFAGLNWGPDAQAYVDAGCTTSTGTPGGDPTPETPLVDDPVEADVARTSVTKATDRAEGGFVDAILPQAGGARLAILLAGLALLGGGTFLLLRRRRSAV